MKISICWNRLSRFYLDRKPYEASKVASGFEVKI